MMISITAIAIRYELISYLSSCEIYEIRGYVFCNVESFALLRYEIKNFFKVVGHVLYCLFLFDP